MTPTDAAIKSGPDKFIAWANELVEGSELSQEQLEILKSWVPLYGKLPNRLKPKLRQQMLIFLKLVKFKNADVPKITEKMRICVAAEACLLILNRSFWDYRYFEQVVIWANVIKNRKGIAGCAFKNKVELNWVSVERGLKNMGDNHNIIIHEFAHVLDFANDEKAQSNPVNPLTAEHKLWEEMIEEEFPKLLKASRAKSDHPIRNYGLKINASAQQTEFFTCATEAFFENSIQLSRACPKIYNALRHFYRLNPEKW
mgnify:CR=1 FL=1|tara:strand:- start:284 stop:1051 length:768 start_codon:yes stop_codon:yes gene_type:complete